MQKTATRSTSCRTNVEAETLILSPVVQQVQETICRGESFAFPLRSPSGYPYWSFKLR